MTIYETQRLASHRDDLAPESATAGTLRDRVRWGPIWAGTIVALPIFLVLQSLFFALGLLDLNFDTGGSDTAASVVSGILALVAFFVGGLLAGSFVSWGDTDSGVLHGILTWALAVVLMVVLALVGAGAVLGSVGSLVTQVNNLQQLFAQGASFDSVQAMDLVRQTAGWTALALGLTATAAGAGGGVGSKFRLPRHPVRRPAGRP